MRVTLTDAERHEEWDAFVGRVPGGDLVQTTAWAATKQALGLRASLVVVRDDRDGCVGGGLLITKRLGPGVAVSYVARGPVAHPGAPWASTVALDALVDRARSLHTRYLIVQPPDGAEHLDTELRRRAFSPGAPMVAPDATVRLDLTRSDDELLFGMSEMRRRNIRRALREGVEVLASTDVELFHRLHTATAARQGFEPLSLSYLQCQWLHLRERGRLMLLVARHEGSPVAAIWLTHFNGTVTFKLAGWDAAAPGPKNVNEMLHWSAVRWARSSGARVYDFGGFDREVAERMHRGEALPESFGRSYSFFKLGFGRPPVLLPQALYLIPSRIARLAVEKSGLLKGRSGQRLADRFRNG